MDARVRPDLEGSEAVWYRDPLVVQFTTQFDVRELATLTDVVPGSSVGRAFGC